MGRYSIQLFIRKNESLLGFVHRIAAANHLGSARLVATDIGIGRITSMLCRETCARLAQLAEPAGADLYQHQLAVYAECAGLRPQLVEKRALRYCPACLAASGVFDFMWDLKLATACPTHGIRLVARCPVCGTELLRDASNIYKCINSHSLLDFTGGNETALAEHVFASRRMWQRIGVGIEEPDASATTFLENTDAKSYFDCMVFLGSVRHYFDHPPRYFTPISRDILFTMGHRYALDWPATFLHDIASFSPIRVGGINIRLLTWLRRSIASGAPREIGTAIARELTRYLAPAGYFVNEGIFGESDLADNRLVLPLREAAELMHLTPRSCREIAVRERLAGWRGLSHPRFCGLLASNVHDWEKHSRRP